MDLEQFLNDIREDCLISSLNDNECFWNAIQSEAYQTNISYQEFQSTVLPVLIDNNLYYEDLVKANVNISGCLNSGNYETCIAENFMSQHYEIQAMSNNYISNNAQDQTALEHRNKEVFKMMVDEAYLQVAISSFSWSGAMWSIAKELIGDKVVDIIIGFIPGFGQSDDVKDAIKAAKNGDWFEFTAEIAGIALQNTPWGKLGKLIDVAPEIVTFYTKVKKIWDKIGSYSEEAIERLWTIARKSPLKINGTYLKYVDDLKSPKLGNANLPDPIPNGYYRYNVYRGAFKAPELSISEFNNLEVHHAVPQAVFESKYPGMITENQLHSLENLRGIAKDMFHPDSGKKLHAHITSEWKNFYINFPDASLEDVLGKVKSVDDEFGHLFVPPIR